MPEATVFEISTIDEYNYLKATYPRLVVDCGATWCGPCRMIAPLIQQWADTYTNVQFAKADIDSGDLADNLGITAVPTLFFIKNGTTKIFKGADVASLTSLVVATASD